MGGSWSFAPLADMTEAHRIKHRVAARDELAARTRKLTGGALTASAVLSGVFAGIAAASAPGHKLHPGTPAQRAPAPRKPQRDATVSASTTIPPLPPPPGPGNLSAAPPPAPAPAPTVTQSAPVVVSGGS
jgi:hypothetical protein